MFDRSRPRRALLSVLAVSLILLAAACGNSSKSSSGSRPGMRMNSSDGMSGMGMEVPGDGLLTTSAGFRLQPATTYVPAGHPSTYTFRITQPAGTVLTSYQVEQTKLLHFYLIRSDLTGFEHLHPALAKDGTWTVTINPATAGSYRVFTQFNADPAGHVTPLVLSQPLTVTGRATADQLIPAPATTTTVDGYTLTIGGAPKADVDSLLTARITQDGRPVTNLQPYLAVSAHLTAFHQGDLAFAHLHPLGSTHGNDGGPDLTFHAHFTRSGNYRVYIQFKTNGILHTGAITIPVS